MATAETTDYALLTTTYELSKKNYLKLRELPVFGKALPFVESTTAYALDKAGLPSEMATLETSYITPALTKLDADYVTPAAATTKKYADTVKDKFNAEALGSREKVETAKVKLDEYKSTAVGYYDDAKELVASSKAKVSAFFANDDPTEVAA